MPPRRRKKPVETRSIAEILKAKETDKRGQMSQKQVIEGLFHELSDEEEDNSTVQLPHMLSEIQDIRPVECTPETFHGTKIYYKCSTLSRVYLRRHSNFDIILKTFCKAKDIKDDPMNDYTGMLMRRLFSVPRYRFDPIYRDFRVDSLPSLAIIHELLKFPKINDFDELKEYELFNRQSGLRPSLVLIDPANDPVANDSMKFMQAKASGRIVQPTQQRHDDFILREYYARSKLLVHIYKVDLTFERLCEISNFEEELEVQMEIDKVTDEFAKEYQQHLVDEFKMNRHMMKHFKVLHFNPRYVLISGNVTASQQETITKSMKKFYKKTNALKILKAPGGWNYTRGSLFELYLNRPKEERDLYPFNDLVYYPDDEDETNLLVTSKKHHHAVQRQRVAFRDKSASPMPSTSKSTPQKSQQPKKPDIECHKMILPPEMDEYLLDIVKILAADATFVDNMRSYFINHYNPDQFNLPRMWRDHKKFILMNIVEQNLRSHSEDALKTLKEMCNEMEDETEMIEELNNYFEAYQEMPTTAEMADKETETEIPEGEVEADATKENQPPSPNITILNVVTVKSCSNVNVTTTTTTSTSNQQSEQPVPKKSAQPEIPDETEEPAEEPEKVAEDEESSDDLGKFNCKFQCNLNH